MLVVDIQRDGSSQGSFQIMVCRSSLKNDFIYDSILSFLYTAHAFQILYIYFFSVCIL